MSLTKRNYVSGETVITAKNLNEIQDAIITLENNDGITPSIGDNGNWYIGSTDTGKPSRGEKGDTGEKGEKGDTGATGPQGLKGNTGAPGIVISSTQPTGDTHPVWLNPDGDAGGEDVSLGISSATVDQIAKISAVDDNGVPTAWEPVDMPSGGDYTPEVIGSATAEDAVQIIDISLSEQAASKINSARAISIIMELPKNQSATERGTLSVSIYSSAGYNRTIFIKNAKDAVPGNNGYATQRVTIGAVRLPSDNLAIIACNYPKGDYQSTSEWHIEKLVYTSSDMIRAIASTQFAPGTKIVVEVSA